MLDIELKTNEIFLLNVYPNENWGVPPFCKSVRRGKENDKGLSPLIGLLK